VAVASDIDYAPSAAEVQRQRRERRRRQVRRRRLTALGVLAALVVAALFGLAKLVGGLTAGATSVLLQPVANAMPTSSFHRETPEEIRGVHITGPLMSLPGKFAQYLALKKDGLNTVEVDLKDESGNVSFEQGAPAIARTDGAARAYFDLRKTVQQAHAAGMYLIGRVVTFEDPITAEQHPELAIHTSDGSIWHTAGGLAWLNPYNRTAWKYDVDVAVAAAKAGFDEIQFDYVRFPSDGDVSLMRFPGPHQQAKNATVPTFLRYARSRIHPLGARLSADVFGLSASHDLGIGQQPKTIGGIVDAIYPMTYPSHYNGGEYNLPDPNAAPGATVMFSLQDFRDQLPVGKAVLVPWLQDFSLYRTYTLRDVKAQIEAARSMHTGGFMLWNAAGIYTKRALAPPTATPSLPVLPAPQL
jgi:hypothetical protein